MRKVLIVGNGVAGISVAKELRLREADATKLEITVLARESYDYYARIRIPEVFGGGNLSAELLALYKPGWYEERRIDVRLGQDLAAIDRRARTITLSSGEQMGYDELVLAMGADPVRPDLPGANLPGVFTLREYDDASRVQASARARPESAAVAGGGLLGLEAARHLQNSGVREVSVVEIAPRLLPRQLDGPGAAVLEAILGDMGLRILTGARIASFDGTDRIEAVKLEDGRRIEARTVVLSMGVRPRTALARSAGLATGKGIVVDRFLRSSDPSIFAVGDCAEFEGVCLGIIPAALEQAPSCAAAILGDESLPYGGTTASNSLKVAGVDLFSAGEVEAAPGTEELRLAVPPRRYERYLFREGKLVGAIVLGSKRRARVAASRMGTDLSSEALEGLLDAEGESLPTSAR
jgi:nitrite reductase (NADH) large subunit